MSFAASIGPIEESGIRERWMDLQQSSTLKTPFASLDYVEDLAAVTDKKVEALFLEGDTVDAGALVLLSRKMGIRHVAPAGFTPFSAIAAQSLPTGAQIHARDSWLDAMASCLGGRFAKTDLMLPPSIQDIRPFQWAHWIVEPLFTFRLSVSDPDVCLRGWSENARRVYNRSQGQYMLRSETRYAPEVVKLCLDGYQRSRRRSPLARSGLEDLARRQIDRGHAACYTVHEDPESSPEAGVIIIGSPPDAFYWIAGSRPGPGMTVLIGKLVSELSSRGFDTFDLVGANTPSIAEFKRRLNPTLVPYYRVRRARNRMMRIFLSLKEAVRH